MKDDSNKNQIAMTPNKQRNEIRYFSISGRLIDVTWFPTIKENKHIAFGKFQISGSIEILNLIFPPDPEDKYGFLLFEGSPLMVHLDFETVNLKSIDEIAFIVKEVDEL